MRKRWSIPHIASSEITSETTYFNRRKFLVAAGLAAAPALGGFAAGAGAVALTGRKPLDFQSAEPGDRNGFHTDETRTPFDDVAAYCNACNKPHSTSRSPSLIFHRCVLTKHHMMVMMIGHA